MVWLIDLIWPQCIAQDGSLCKKIPPFPVLLGGRQMLHTAVDANRRHIVRLNLLFTQLCLLCLWVSWSYVWPSAVKFPLYSVEWLPIAIGLSVAKYACFESWWGFFVCLFICCLVVFFSSACRKTSCMWHKSLPIYVALFFGRAGHNMFVLVLRRLFRMEVWKFGCDCGPWNT